MLPHRLTELVILGYRIDRIDPEASDACRYEVLGPEHSDVLAVFGDRPAAEKFVITRELQSIAMRPRSPVY